LKPSASPGLHAADTFSRKKRSAVMAAVRERPSVPLGDRLARRVEQEDGELQLIAIFLAHGTTGWRRNRPLFGKPDFVFPTRKLAVFVDGCFWHGCPLHATQPKTNAAFCRKKLAANRTRDRLVTRSLRARGWSVLRIWQHALRRKHEQRLLVRLHKAVL